VVVLSGREDGRTVYEAFKAGARGFGARSAPPEEVLGIVEAVAGGGVAVGPAAATAGLLWVTRAGGSNDRLSSREREVLDLLRAGLPARVIGERLFLSRRTVESYLASAYRKLGVRGRHEAVEAYARLDEAG
jgi:DNA-binding NarL/FixJ family response regulator